MASPQKENGFTGIANELLENIYKGDLSLREIKIILAVIRFTFGFNRKSAELSLRFLSQATNIKYRHTQATVSKLISSNILLIENESKGIQSRKIQLNKNYDLWNARDDQKSITNIKLDTTEKVSLDTTDSVVTTHDQKSIKERKKKTLNKKDSDFLNILPEELRSDLFIVAWKGWITHRKEIKKKLTESSAKKQLNFLMAQENPVDIIEQSIRNGWQGLFPLKVYNNGNGHYSQQSNNNSESTWRIVNEQEN